MESPTKSPSYIEGPSATKGAASPPSKAEDTHSLLSVEQRNRPGHTNALVLIKDLLYCQNKPIRS